jgi:hypothetical protein
LETRIEAHIFVAFLAYCLMVTLKRRLTTLAPGLTSTAVLEKLAVIQMIDVELPTTDGRTIILSRRTEPEGDQRLLLCIKNTENAATPKGRIPGYVVLRPRRGSGKVSTHRATVSMRRSTSSILPKNPVRLAGGIPYMLPESISRT